MTYTIADQAIGFRPDTRVLLVAQRWTVFSENRHALALSANDRITSQRAGTANRVADDFARAAGQIRQWVVTEEQARDHLERMGQPRQRRCVECDAKLPLGGLYCVICGLNQTVPAAHQPPARLVVAQAVPE